jgi:hypothetical protein
VALVEARHTGGHITVRLADFNVTGTTMIDFTAPSARFPLAADEARALASALLECADEMEPIPEPSIVHAYATAGLSGLVPSVVVVIRDEGLIEEFVAHLTPVEGMALGSKLIELATTTRTFIEITRDDTPSGGL